MEKSGVRVCGNNARKAYLLIFFLNIIFIMHQFFSYVNFLTEFTLKITTVNDRIFQFDHIN